MKKSVVISLFLLLSLFIGTASAVEVTLFGPKQYVRTSGSPDVFTAPFTALFPEIVSNGKLIVFNGNQIGEHRVTDAVSSAEVFVNGEQIFGPNDFNQNVYYLEAPIALVQDNSITVELRSNPGSYVSIQVTQDIDPPSVSISASPDAIKVNEISTLTWSSILANTCSIDSDIGSVDVNGSITVSPDETTTYTITASGPGGVTTASTTITHVNSVPVADDQSITTSEDTAVPITLTASDLDNEPLVCQIVTYPTQGTLSGEPPNVTYSPSANYYGSDSFTFKANDGQADSEPATVSITVTPVNDAPVAGDDATTTDEDASITTGNVLANDTDVEGDILTIAGFTQPANGTVVGHGDGTFTYTPTLNFNGTDSFDYTVDDVNGGTDTATVTVTVNAVNDAPIADAGPDQTVIAGDAVALDGSGSDDLDGDALTYAWSFVSMPAESGATLSDPSLVNPTFVADVSGTYELQLIVNDGTAGSDPDTVTITANPRIVQVPDVVGVAQAEAEAAILAADLTVGTITTANSETVPEGNVISQNPAAGISVEEGSTVDLVVSLGPAITTPTVSISATPEVISVGESATLTWLSTNADACFIEPDIGSVPVDGSTTVSPPSTTTYSITAVGPEGVASAQAVVMVMGNPEPQPEGSFGEQYEDLVPPDATVESYDPRRFSLITGLVQDLASSPIADVAVTVHSHPEYGTVETDAQGRFSIPVEGGGTMTLVYQKDGLLTVQRKVYVPWTDIAIAETIVMIAQDPVSTTHTFDGNPETVVTHQSTEVTDEFGSRSCSMIFTGDNMAYLLDEEGNDIQQLTTITTRATEYTTPESMPAILPPNSAYTYCVELNVDGAERVRFDEPVITWVDNFLGFDVGEIVPVGYYDRDRGVWVPSDNGVVVKLLDTDMDGIVDALDADGDDQPDDLNEDGSFSDEVMGLDNAQRYPPGSTFWRVAVTHFTPWDHNWPWGRHWMPFLPTRKGSRSRSAKR